MPTQSRDSLHIIHATISPLGGAGAVATRLYRAQSALGHKTGLTTLFERPFPRWAAAHPGVAVAALIDFLLVRKNRQSSFFSLWRRQHQPRIARRLRQHRGVLHLHWLPGMLRPAELFASPPAASALVWTMHDLWPLTGGCHFAYDCTEFERDCANCPQARRPFHGMIRRTLAEKRTAMQQVPEMCLVTPSDWAAQQVLRSSVMQGLKVRTIPNPVDTTVFRPFNREQQRQAWGCRDGDFVIGLGAADLGDTRKQIAPTLLVLQDWFLNLPDRSRIKIVVYGGGKLPSDLPTENFRLLGKSPDATTLATWYSAMDLHLSLSLYETFGNTLAEAAACGVPSICRTGSGAAEVVSHDEGGFHLTEIAQLPSLLESLRTNPAQCKTLGQAAYTRALRLYDSQVVAQQYLSLYSELQNGYSLQRQ